MYEVFDGGRTVINVEPTMSGDALTRYFQMQGRFRKANIDPARAKAAVERAWRELRARAALDQRS